MPTAPGFPQPAGAPPEAPRTGLLQLRFADPDLERRFHQHWLAEFLPRLKRCLQAAILVVLAFACVDALSLPPALVGPVLALHLGAIIPALLLAWGALYLPRVRPWLQGIVGVCAFAIGLAIVGIIFLARRHGFDMPYEGVIMATFFFYFLTGLRFTAAAASGWLVFVAYVAVEQAAGLAIRGLAYNALYLAASNVIGCFGSHYMEKSLRRSFLYTEELHKHAEHDALTGLLNRRALIARGQSLLRHASRAGHGVGVAMIDVDHFKLYNDLYGHGQGDEALRAVAAVISEEARRPLDVGARYGGEEFVVLWCELDAAHGLELAERLRARVEGLGLPHAASPTASRVTVSIGLACIEAGQQMDLDDALRVADEAMYRAKQSGRNRVCLGTASPPPDAAPPPPAPAQQ